MFKQNPKDHEALVSGLTFGAITAGGLIFFAFVTGHDHQGSDNSQKFKIIDSYHSCNIVRYTDISNRFHYFMDCNNGKPD